MPLPCVLPSCAYPTGNTFHMEKVSILHLFLSSVWLTYASFEKKSGVRSLNVGSANGMLGNTEQQIVYLLYICHFTPGGWTRSSLKFAPSLK